ncbi:MAG: hypothetical protein JNK82_36520 [Myxococcaceae bacterium]|nr:hypothetical protein [Myxococcaceae bacterium]
MLVLCLAAPPALAMELAREDDGAVVEVSGFYKNLLFGVAVPNGPAGAMDAQILRAQTRFLFAEVFELDVAYQLQFVLATDPAFVGGTSLSGTIGGTGAGPQRRLVPLESVVASTPTSVLTQNLDRLAMKFALPFGDLTIGRQVLSWGTGRFFNPTDVLSPFPPTVIDREVRRGFDAVRLAIALGETTQLDLLWLPQLVAEEHGGVARFQTNVLGWDFSISAGKYVRDFVVGFDLVGDVGPVNVHAEGAYTIEWLKAGAVGEHFFRGVAGADWRPHEVVMLTLEYSYNGYGTTDPSRYVQVLTSVRARRGEVFGAGKHVVAAAASWRANDLLSTSLAVLCNVADPSAVAIASLEYSFTQRVLVRAGAYVPMGRPPVNGQLKSEYGSGAFGAFAQVGVYVP